MLVKMPENVPQHLLEKETMPASSKRSMQRVCDILGKTVGRVPANLCRVFAEMMERDYLVGQIQCIYGGSAHQTKDVPVQQAFRKARTRYGRDVEGG